MKEMNEMNQLETQLHCWKPRPPSAALSRRLFPGQLASADGSAQQAAPKRSEGGSPPFRLSWLAPASIAFTLVCLIFNQRHSPSISGSGSSQAMVAMILSNQSYAPYLSGSFQSEQNALPKDTFEW